MNEHPRNEHDVNEHDVNEHDGSGAGTPLQPAEIDELLSGLASRPVEEHVAVYDQVHRRLRDHLSADRAGAGRA